MVVVNLVLDFVGDKCGEYDDELGFYFFVEDGYSQVCFSDSELGLFSKLFYFGCVQVFIVKLCDVVEKVVVYEQGEVQQCLCFNVCQFCLIFKGGGCLEVVLVCRSYFVLSRLWWSRSLVVDKRQRGYMILLGLQRFIKELVLKV